MGAVPKRRISKGRKGRRRAHNAIKVKSVTKCPKCGSVKRSHFECQYCGYYNKSK
jgi:large subunit ribosomal protein L32